jgi:type IV pilus assembly protein PilF
MSAMAGRIASPLLLAVLVAALAGCQTTSTTTNSAAPPTGRTNSDEPDQQRRAQARVELAAAYYSRNQLQTSLEQLRIALAADPTLAPAWNLRGLVMAGLGENAEADASFRRALQLAPRDGDALHNYGWHLCQQQRWAEAQAQFAQAVAIPAYRGASRTLMASGVCQARAGDLIAAEGALLRANELDPANPVILTNLAEVLLRRGEFERARFHIRRVNAMSEVANAQTLWLAARIENRLGNRQGTADLGMQLRNRFPESREAGRFARGEFDE